MNNYVILVLEFVERGNLYKFFLENKDFFNDQMKVISLFAGICEGINYIHKRNMIHRDIKPENVLIDNNFEPKLCDFGWATKIVRNEARTTFCGTFDYMAPEVFESLKYNSAVDIWSLGVLLFELFHGYSPYKGKNAFEIFNNIKTKELVFKEDLDPRIQRLIRSMLQKNPLQRPKILDVIKTLHQEFGVQIDMAAVEEPVSPSRMFREGSMHRHMMRSIDRPIRSPETRRPPTVRSVLSHFRPNNYILTRAMSRESAANQMNENINLQPMKRAKKSTGLNPQLTQPQTTLTKPPSDACITSDPKKSSQSIYNSVVVPKKQGAFDSAYCKQSQEQNSLVTKEHRNSHLNEKLQVKIQKTITDKFVTDSKTMKPKNSLRVRKTFDLRANLPLITSRPRNTSICLNPTRVKAATSKSVDQGRNNMHNQLLKYIPYENQILEKATSMKKLIAETLNMQKAIGHNVLSGDPFEMTKSSLGTATKMNLKSCTLKTDVSKKKFLPFEAAIGSHKARHPPAKKMEKTTSLRFEKSKIVESLFKVKRTNGQERIVVNSKREIGVMASITLTGQPSHQKGRSRSPKQDQLVRDSYFNESIQKFDDSIRDRRMEDSLRERKPAPAFGNNFRNQLFSNRRGNPRPKQLLSAKTHTGIAEATSNRNIAMPKAAQYGIS